MDITIQMEFIDLDVYLDLIAEKLGWDKSRVEEYCRRFGPVFRTEDDKHRVLVFLHHDVCADESPVLNLIPYLCKAFNVSEDDKINSGEKNYGDFLFDLQLYSIEKGGARLNLWNRNREPGPHDDPDNYCSEDNTESKNMS